MAQLRLVLLTMNVGKTNCKKATMAQMPLVFYKQELLKVIMAMHLKSLLNF